MLRIVKEVKARQRVLLVGLVAVLAICQWGMYSRTTESVLPQPQQYGSLSYSPLSIDPLVPEAESQTVVLAMAAYPNADAYVSSPFIWSLRCTGYDGLLVLLVPPSLHNSPPPKLQAFFRDMNVTTIPIHEPPYDCHLPSGDEGEGVSVDVRCLGPEMSRYVAYRDALQDPRLDLGPRTRLLLQDFRDTIFQAPPFSIPEHASLVLFSEYPHEPIGDSFWTTMWIANCFGQGATRLLYGKPVLCSGSIMGTKSAVLRYLRAMESAMSLLGGRQHCRDYGVDQGYHNYLAFTHAFDAPSTERAGAAAIRVAGRSHVHTIGRFCSGPQGHEVNHTRITSAEEGSVIMNEDGEPAPVVHQIDRCKAPHYVEEKHHAFLLSKCPNVAAIVAEMRQRED